MDEQVKEFLSEIYQDLTIDREEGSEIQDFFTELNPPPDKLVSIRAAALRIACEFLSEDDNDANVSLLRCINVVVHVFERTCMRPRSENEGAEEVDMEEVDEFYRGIFSDLSIDREESADLYNFFESKEISLSQLTPIRAAAFRIGCEFLSEDDTSLNVTLLRCINYIVHVFEQTQFICNPYELQIEVPESISVEAIGLEASIEQAIQQLWDLDVNRLVPNEDYEINVQDGKKPYYKEDFAEDPLFTHVDASALRRPTYKTFIALLDNYSAEVGDEEEVLSEEREEITTFLDVILQTGPMQFCHQYLVANNEEVPAERSEFRNLLYRVWFQLYHRSHGGRADSSGFEHVFVGEIKNEKVSGFHNWVRYYIEEQNGSIDYQGYIKPRSNDDAETDEDDFILTLQFKWNDILKSVGTMFIGVSPEFEMALYTLCFLMGNENNVVNLNTGSEVFEMNIKCFSMAHGKIGTSFPELLHHYEE